MSRSCCLTISFTLVIISFFTGCRKTPLKGDVIGIDLEVVRFEKLLFESDIYAMSDSAKIIAARYPEFAALFTNRIIEIGDTSEPGYGFKLSKFVTDQAMYGFYQSSRVAFPDFSTYRDALELGLSKYKYHFPEKELPVIYTYVSGLNQSIVTADGILGISLDKYLGDGNDAYTQVYPPIPNYLLRVMQPEYMASDALRAWVGSDIYFNPEKNNFLSRVLNEARTVYLTKQMLPEINDTVLWGFSSAQLAFCKSNEAEMWKYLIDQKLLFSTDNFRISKFIEPGPFTKDFTRESPARAAVWIGYQIIDSYVARNKGITLQELASTNDFQTILNESKYNP
jgi:hypothetical protein